MAIKKFSIPNQKTFIFKNENAEQIDEFVNEWIQKQVLKGQPPVLGKCFSNHYSGEIIYVYFFTEQKEIEVAEPKKN